MSASPLVKVDMVPGCQVLKTENIDDILARRLGKVFRPHK